MDKPWIKITEVYGNMEGEALKSFMEAHEVPVRLIQESMGPLIGSVIPAFGLVEVFVPSGHVKIAKELLTQYEGEVSNNEAPPSWDTPQ